MFSSTDSPDARFVKAYLLTGEGEVPAWVPGLDETWALCAAPTAENLELLAQQLAGQRWVRSNSEPAVRSGKPAAAQVRRKDEPLRETDVPVPYSAIRIELWRSAFDDQTSQLRTARYLAAVRQRQDANDRPGTAGALPRNSNKSKTRSP
jgi:hypothetical protein